MQSCLSSASDFPKILLLFAPRERLGQALAALGADFLLFTKPDTDRIHSWIMRGDGGKRGRRFFSDLDTSISYFAYLWCLPPKPGGREWSCRALGRLLQLRIIVMYILLTVASILGTAWWSVTENLESNILNILIRFGSKTLLKWIWMAMWCDTIWIFLLFGHRVGGCFGIDKIRMLSEQSMLTLPQWSRRQISVGEILAFLTSTGALPSTSGWHTFSFYLELA